jgi:prepilin-type N-terminal cleavage/methylation domain-containing protein
MRNTEQTIRRGFTLIEMVIVVMILAIIAGIVVPLISGSSQISTPGGQKSERRIVTETTMLAIRDTFLSTGTRTGLWADMGHVPARLPLTIHQLFLPEPPLTGTPTFNPVTKIGWRGPYFAQPTGTYPDITTTHQMTGNTWSADNFTSTYGATADRGFVDAWGNPIVLQIDFPAGATPPDESISAPEAQAARLVSAGPDGTIAWELDITQTEEDYRIASQNHQIDDVVIYLGIGQ